MGQLNKVISALILLAIAGFVLWLLVTKTQSVKSFFSRNTTLTQSAVVAKTTATQAPTKTQSQAKQSEFQAEATRLLGNANPKGGAVAPERPQVQSPPATRPSQAMPTLEYPKTGTQTLVLPLTAALFFLGRRLIRTTKTN